MIRMFWRGTAGKADGDADADGEADGRSKSFELPRSPASGGRHAPVVTGETGTISSVTSRATFVAMPA